MDFGGPTPAPKVNGAEWNAFATPAPSVAINHDFADFASAPPPVIKSNEFASFQITPATNTSNSFAAFSPTTGAKSPTTNEGFSAFQNPTQTANNGGFASFSNSTPLTSQKIANAPPATTNAGFGNFTGTQTQPGLQQPLNTNSTGFKAFNDPSDDFGAFESVPKKPDAFDPISKLVSLDAFSLGSNGKKDSVGPSLNALQSNKI